MRRTPIAALCLLAAACATVPMSPSPTTPDPLPVMLVHGIDDHARQWEPLRRYLAENGFRDFAAVELTPNDGRGGLAKLAAQLDDAARKLCQRTGAKQIDVVGFSMGALVSRYWLKRVDGHVPVRRYVSISGPHHGTWAAYLRWNEGTREMRPGSAFIADLSRDEADWGEVRPYSFWTPMDLAIVPATSSHLEGAVERKFPVVLHPLMVFDGRVMGAVLQALTTGDVEPQRGFDRTPGWP